MRESDATTRRALLAGHPLLRELPSAELDRLAAHTITRFFPAHAVIFRKGDVAQQMMVVLFGHVRISAAATTRARETVFNIVGPGEMFGEVAVVDGGHRTADAIALEDCAVVAADRAELRRLLAADGRFALGLLDLVCRRLRATSEQVEDLSFLDLPQRLAKRLAALARTHGEPAADGLRIVLSLPNRELGAMAGATREAINKQMRGWKDAGIVALARNSVTIRDLGRLDALARDDAAPRAVEDAR